MRIRGTLSKSMFAALLALALVFLLLPFAVQMIVSLKLPAEIFSRPFQWVPQNLNTSNFKAALGSEIPFFGTIRNSFVIASITTAVCLVLGSLCAYAVSRLKMRGKGILLGSLLAVSLFPQISVVSTLFLMLRKLSLLNSYSGLILVYSAFNLPLTVWFLTAYFREIPVEIEEAARVDGCSNFQFLTKILTPLSIPGLLTAGVLVFIMAWNEFLFALIFNPAQDLRTATVGIALFPGIYEVPWGTLFAAATIVILPPLLIFLPFQQKITSGLTSGSVKG